MFLLTSKEVAPVGAAGGQAQDFDVLGATGNGEGSLHGCLRVAAAAGTLAGSI
jgi:hypothetical protein